jgi:hypothetical protein
MFWIFGRNKDGDLTEASGGEKRQTCVVFSVRI